MIAFTFPLPNSKFAKSIMLLDGVTGEAQQFGHEFFNFTNTRTVVVKNQLYAFKVASPVSAYKIANFFSNDHQVITLPTLPCNEYL